MKTESNQNNKMTFWFIWKMGTKVTIGIAFLWIALYVLVSVGAEDSKSPILDTILGIVAFLLGGYFTLPAFDSSLSHVLKKLGNGAKVVLIISLFVTLIVGIIASAYYLIAGISATTVIIILLVMIYTKLDEQGRLR